MQTKPSVFLAVATAVFALGAFAQTRVAYAGDGEKCSGKDVLCASGECTTVCPNVQEPEKCYKICPLEKKGEE